MVPASPPLPTTWSLPFQLSAGSQTSKWICEFGVGFNRPWTSQKAGKLSMARLPRPPSGGVKEPAARDLAAVIVVLASVMLVRPSQFGAAAAVATDSAITNAV